MHRSALALLIVLAPACAQSVGGSLFGPGDDDSVGLPAHRGQDAGTAGTAGLDGGPGGSLDAGPGSGPDGGAGGGIDGGPGAPAACITWQDCPPHLGDPFSGFSCLAQTCICDPDGQIATGCASLGGFWRAADCYCEVLGPEPAACQQWQDCPPHYASQQSGYDCVDLLCSCDPGGQYQQTCAGLGGYWISSECFCAFAGEPPPSYAPEPDCWWHWEEPPCDPERWVDTSYQEEECSYDGSGQRVCQWVWVYDGYWEPGACPAPYWDQRCYG
jgi:hypothetical protein